MIFHSTSFLVENGSINTLWHLCPPLMGKVMYFSSSPHEPCRPPLYVPSLLVVGESMYSCPALYTSLNFALDNEPFFDHGNATDVVGTDAGSVPCGICTTHVVPDFAKFLSDISNDRLSESASLLIDVTEFLSLIETLNRPSLFALAWRHRVTLSPNTLVGKLRLAKA